MTTAPIINEPASAPIPRPRVRKWVGRFIGLLLLGAALAGAVWWGRGTYRSLTASNDPVLPTATVQRGDLSLSVTSKGEVRGGNPESLIAPMTGGRDMHITDLLKNGTPIKAGDVVIQFDTTEQEFLLKEAQSDLAEADQKILQAKAQRAADEEEDRYALMKARTDVRLAELDVRQNPLLPAINAKQNDLALAAARDHLTQLEQYLKNRRAGNDAAIATQEAGRSKAESQAKTAQQNIEAMAVRAKGAGYVYVKPNTNVNFYFGGNLPPFQVGDAVNPGMTVAEIPDLKDWEVVAKLGELDRGHLTKGDQVEIAIVALPHHAFTGHVKDLGGMTGQFWNRRFECKISLDNPIPELRPGMSAKIVITTDRLHDVLWLPAQALFEADGKTFVYAKTGATFTPKDVKLVRRNETRVVITGIDAGQVVALSNPTDSVKKNSAGGGGAMQALPK